MTTTSTPMLSRLSFDPFHPDGRRAISTPDRMHKATCALVDSKREDANLLWRLEHDQNAEQVVLMQTTTPMSYNGEGPPGHVTIEGPRSMGRHLDLIAEGSRIRYTIDVNAVWQPDGGTKLKSVPRSKIPEWWIKKAARVGLSADRGTIRYSTDNRQGPKGRLLFVARIDGTGTVSDPNQLRTAITLGIGKAKAFGCGLLTIQHLR